MQISSDQHSESKWVSFELKEGLFAISVENVKELVLSSSIVKIPNTPDYIRGVINLRNTTLPVIDLRLRLGMPSLAEGRKDLIEMMKARKQDHIDWLKALYDSVENCTEFKKALDPHKCAFGKWYDMFHTDDLTLGSLLKKFDAPHKAIHGIGAKVIGLAKEGKCAEAHAIIENTRSRELHMMINLFDTIIAELGKNSNQVIMVAETDGMVFGMIVDRIDAVVTLTSADMGPTPNMYTDTASFAITGVARPKGYKKLILLLQPKRLVTDQDLAVA